MIHDYTGIYITCDEPGCTIQSGGFNPDHLVRKTPPLAYWDWSVEGKHYCPRHRKDNDDE